MTVCIAAVCNIGPNRPPCVVAACDRMITIGGLQYEPQQRKVVELASTTIVLFAGDMQLHAVVTTKVQDRIKQLVSDRDPPRLTVAEIAELYALEFGFYRRALAEREILMPRGMDFDRFSKQQSTLPHYQVRELDAMLAAHAIDSTAIIAGLDHMGAHVFRVRDPGVAESFAIPYFACAGSGKDIAETQFMVAQYDKQWSLAKALWLTYSAKARAQVAGGVGPKTDLIMIAAGKIEYATEEQVDGLFALFQRVIRKEREYNDEAVATLEASFAAASGASTAPPHPAKPEGTDAHPHPLGDLGSVGDTGAVDPPTSS
jgi:20S proteasome alpha/beta subunit